MITLKKIVKNETTGQEHERVVDFHEIDVKNALSDGWVPFDQEIVKEAPVAPEKNSGRPPFKTKSQKDDAPPESIAGV